MKKQPADSRGLGDPGTAAFRVGKYPFFLLNRLVSRYNGVIEPRLRAIGLDIPYWRVLMILGEHSPRGVRDLADAAVIPLSTMTRIVQRMATVGLVEAGPSAEDARVTMVSLSAMGEEKLVEARRATSPVYARTINGLSARDFERLVDLLERLHANLEG
ncbi:MULTISPECIES: MarR family winged helix-turn-helix transcriptional regulator [unclassified Sphingomonas]|uniref:MarR family winged helix-turn-helix transcriptional regulator n=1 Tax=unclassified Sphingomonas TaxID=196159 RepID=UPI00092CAF61|nr:MULTISPECIES: MarR family winged helix-turn-helix transcriptional regulator [unclassified Sphingomonas]MBN8846632.1 winged helix-turn-helix transcriptional regulator [Sphingomonas sp.]OJV34137.1 MAG: MarR family transcriptional regulator [Sphingomonas sp. 67-36]